MDDGKADKGIVVAQDAPDVPASLLSECVLAGLAEYDLKASNAAKFARRDAIDRFDLYSSE